MNDSHKFSDLFPRPGTILAAFNLAISVDQTIYLVDGNLRQWSGPFLEMLSPVCVETEVGCSRVVIGHYPSISLQCLLQKA